jgi:LysR family transcriptional regulator, carnitine catabolism transcriptional activator
VTLPETDDLRAFIEVVAEGTFTAAAQRLHTSQPALSRRIARLEHQIGGILFERENRREPLLTVLGQTLLPYAEKALSDLDQFALAAKEQTQGETGELVVAIADALVDACLPHLVRHARQRLPGLRIRVREVPSGEVPDMLVEHHAEMGLLTSQFAAPEIEGVTYGIVQHVAMGLPAYLGASTEGMEWEQLAKLPLLLPLPLERVTYPIHHPITVAHERGSPGLLLAMARSGLGVAVLAGLRPRAGITCRPIEVDGVPQRSQVELAWRRDGVLSRAGTLLVSDARNRLAELGLPLLEEGAVPL